MKNTLRFHLFLLSCAPLALLAQVEAGNVNAVIHTTVGITLAPLPMTPGVTSKDTVSLDLEGNGTRHLLFTSGTMDVVDFARTFNTVDLEHAGVEVAVEGAGSIMAKRLTLGEMIDANLHWKAFSSIESNFLYLSSTGSSLGVPQSYGANEWFANGAVATEGYLGVRLVQDGVSRYGWIGLVSYIGPDSAWLQINELGMQDLFSSVASPAALERITAQLLPDGRIVLQGPLEAVQRITVQDLSGRVLREGSGAAPYAMDLGGEARGVYVLAVFVSSGMRTFKLAW